MRVIAQQWVSVDGFVAGPTGEDEHFAAMPAGADEESQRHNAGTLLPRGRAALLGRRTHDSFVRVWPFAGDAPMAAEVNRLPKVVCSTTLTEAPWPGFAAADVVRDGVAHARALRGEGGDDLVVLWGSVDLMGGLLAAGQVDLLELFVVPVLLGRGARLLDGAPVPLRRTETDVWPSGLSRVRYALGEGG